MPIALIPIIAGIAEAAAGYAAFSVAAGFTLANVMAGAAMVGGAMTAVGAATGDKNLSRIGSVAGTIGAAGSIASLVDAVGEGGTNLFANDVAGNYSNVGGGATASEATQQAAEAGSTVSQVPSNVAPGDIAGATQNAANATPAQENLVDANTPKPDLNTNPTGSAGIAGPPGSPSGPTAMPNVTPNATPDPYGAGSGYGKDTLSAMGQGSSAPGNPASGSLWDHVTDAVKDAWKKDPAAVMKTGAGMVQGLASYIAPSPLERAQINDKNAAMERLKYEQQQRANLNNSIRGLNPGVMGPSFNGAPGAAMQPSAPQFGAAPGAVMPTPLPVTGAMPQQQPPGLLQGAMYG